MRNTAYRLLLVMCLCFLITGCGHVKNANSLVKMAKNAHGRCEVISKTETDEKTTVILKDELQGFQYEVYSSMTDINIDGASFGSVPGTTDTFDSHLQEYVLEETKEEREKICQKYNVNYDTTNLIDYTDVSMSSKVALADGIKAVEEIGALLQEYNLESRLDGFTINLVHDKEWLKDYYNRKLKENDGDIYSDSEFSGAGGATLCHIGSVKLPDCTFRDKEKENEDYYLEMAHMKSQYAKYVRREKKTFADTGLPLSRVSNTAYQDYPEKMSDPVTFYYYDVNGTEFFICDFLDVDTGTWYTNYDDVKPKEPEKKLINFHISLD